ncbi:histone-lysine N-methyltransferase 2C-like isoform X2 [Syngnathus typhle]|uniref:histone-lysine N-methyltransferase 2C-like isoform X2 n=1 Tax=Syngnathus typhle TaxID=161592 RepID=UPI002A69F29D|nr:histone-lysine N-methyltransferase 2C-like isoform X2 [Syngnathus typhle]
MPSEDRRAPPPVTRAGRKAAESAKRPRGRPRKDAVGGRAVPPPASPPPTKSRKKGRSRGQAQVEDEEGVDTTEKRQMAEVTTGRRGSASRRRSNTEPILAVPEAPPCEPPLPLAPPLTSITEEEPSQNGAIAPPPPPDSPGDEMSRASLASSPAPSSPLRLEDDDAPSPLLRRSVSEDSGSPTPSLGHTEKRLQQCAFCYRGEHPPLGQGPLVVFGPTPGYIPLHVLSRRTSPDRDGDCHDHCYPRGQAVHTNSSSPAQCDDESSSQLLEQLGAVGLPHDIDVQSLFDPTGQCCAHLQCAAWSEGVCRGEGQALLYVDKAIDSGSSQVCAFCGGLGASLRCRETGCGQSYHFPCAAAAGAHQDWEQRRTLCTRHTHAESRSCVVCSRGGDAGALLMCCCCGNQYHAKCLAPPLNPSSLIRAGWQCAPCRACQRCRLREETSVLLVCARCDKAYHPHCLTLPLDHTPDSKWTCQNCRVCRRCGVRSSGRWANHPFLCVSCDPALPCGVCGHTPDVSSLQDCVTCVHCYRCVHTQCVSVETGVGATKCDRDSYVCSACQRAEPAALPIISPSPDVQSPTIPTSTPAHSPVQFSSSTQAQTPTDENPVPSPSDATEPPSPSSPTEQRLCLVLSPSDPAELQQSPTSSPSSNEQRLSLVLSPSDPSELQQSPASSPSSPTELQESPQSSPSHAAKPEQKSPEHTYPTELRLVLSPSDPAEFQQSPGSSSSSSSSKPKELRLSPTQSPYNPTDLHPSPEQSPLNATVQRQSPPASPANLSVLPEYPTPSSCSELRQSPSFSSETRTSLDQHSPPQSPSEGMALQPLNCHQAELQLSPVLSLSDTTEFPKSQVPSPSNVTDPQQSPMPSPSNTTTLFLSPTPSPSMVAELHSSPGPSSSEPTEFQKGSVPSLSNNTELEQKLLPCPKVTESPQSPTPSPSNVTELHLKPVPSPLKLTDMQQSSVPSPSDLKVRQLSAVQPLSDDTELQQNALQAPNITEFQQSATPSPSSVTELHLIPVSSTLEPTKVPQSPVASPYTKDLHLSPERHPSNVTAFPPSPVPFPNITEIQHCPTSPPLKTTEPSPLSPSNTTALHLNLVSSLNSTELQQSPVLSPSNVNDILCSQVSSPTHIAEVQQCPTPSPSKISELGLSPVPSSSKPTEFQQNPLTSPTNVLQPHQRPGSPPSNITEVQQNPTPCLSNITEIPHSPSPSPSNIQNLQQSPKPTLSNVTMSHQNPLPTASNVPNISSDVTELHRSSASSPCTPELHQNPATSPNITALDQSSPTSPYAPELHQNPATSPNITALDQSSPTSPYAPELRRNPATSPNITALDQSSPTSPYAPELHQNPASPIITELNQSSTASPYAPELHQNPATSPNVTELHQSTAASPCAPELHQNPATSPNITELHQSTTASPCTPELHQNPATSPNVTELHQSTTASPCAPELHQNPATSPNITELHQSTTAFPCAPELHQNPATSPNITELHQSTASPCAPELHQNPGTSPNITELHQSSTASPYAPELHQNPATSNITEIDQSSATSPYSPELHQTPATSPNITELHQSSTASPYTPELHQNPATSNVTELRQSLVTSPSHGTRLCQSPVPPPSVTVCPSISKSTVLHHSPVPSPSNATITRPSPVSSPAIPTELQPSPLPSPSSELHDNPVLLASEAAEQIHKFEEPQNIQEPVLQPPPPSPVELVSGHPSSFESAELHKCPAAPQLCPIQVQGPQVNHVPWERKERHSRSPIANLCSTPPPLPSVPLNVERNATRLTSTPLQLSPPSSLSIDSSREKLAKSPVWCSVLSERSPCRLDDADVAKPAREAPELERDLSRDSNSPACLESVVCNTAADGPAPSTLSTPQSEPSSPLGHLPSPAPASLVHQNVSVDLGSLPLVLSETGTVEDVLGDQSDSPDSRHRTGSSGASPAGSFQAPCKLMTDTASVEHSPVRTCPSDQPGSPVMPTGSSCQPAASALSLDASVGERHAAGCAPDPNPPRLPLSGGSSPLPVPKCRNAFETKPSHSTGARPTYCRPVDASSDSQGLITLVMESSVFSSNQSSHSSSSSTPPEAAETCPRSPTGSTDSSPQVDTQATSPEENPLQLDSGPGVTLEPARKTKSPSYQPGGPAASHASPTFPRQFPAPLGPSSDRAAGSSTQAHGDLLETGCARETQAREADWSQLFRHAESIESPEQPETGTGSALHTRLQSETGPSDAGSASAVSSEAESTSITTDQEPPLHLHQYLPDTSEGVPDQAENKQHMLEEENAKQMQEENREQQQQEENLLQNQEQPRTLRCLPSGTEQAVSSNNLQKEADDVSLGVHPSSGEPAAASPFFSTPPSPSSPSPSASPPPWPDISSAASPPPSAEPDCSSEWPREDFREMLESTNDAASSRAGSSERDDAVAMKPRREESDSGGEAVGGADPSFDSEVMTLMSSLSPSASLSPRPLHMRSLRPPPRSLPPTDELSIRLRQSPFSTEASPETSPNRVPLTPPPLSPPSPSVSPPSRELPPLCKTSPSASAVIPLTRKISMGKPAISKRKFSPGRSCVRQGSWWSNTRPVSPHSSSQDSVGEGGQDSPKSRQADSPLWSMRVGRGSGFPGRRRSRGGGGAGGGRGGRGRARLKTQDFVSVSPAYGFVESVPPKEEEEENSMHNTVVMFSTSDIFTLQQDMCVVCGSFGRGAEGRLLACSQCGQCYHPYCVNVKVTRVILTKGWRCLECTVCEACGEATDPGRLLLCDDCDISYHTYCLDPPLHTVPKGAWKCKWCVWCVQCGSASPGPHCDWQSNYSHCGPCASLTCCPLCQRAYAHDDLILQCQQCDRWVHAVCEGLATEDEAEDTADEGFDCSLCRTHSRVPLGRPDNLDMAQILSRSREADTKTYSQDGVCLTELGLSQLQSLVEPLTSARRYRRYKPKLKLRIINQNSVSVLQTPPHPDAGHLECDLKSDSSPERELALDDDVSKDVAKRKRKPYRPGIGGFMVRQRGGKAGGAAVKGGGEQPSGQTPQADEDGAERTADKAKKRYRKKKTKLEEAFPSYLQEAFFGRDLLYRIRQVDQRMLSEAARISQSGAVDTPSGKLIKAKQERLCPDIGSVIHDPLLTSEPTGSGGRGQKALHEEPLDAILNPELDKMVTDGALLSKLHKIPELEGKDVEDLFIAVLSPDSSQQHNQYTHTAGSGAFPRLALLNGLAGHAAKSDNVPGVPVCGGTPCPLQANQAAAEGEHDAMSTAQRSMMKWEKEEALGEQATVAPVLYCNTNFPQLREHYPEWSTRVKQIAKLWRKASSQDRAPYVQRARDNRAAQRIHKVHMCSEPPKRTHPCPPPPQVPYDTGCPDAADSALRDPFRPRESEQEQEWRLRQGEVKDRWRAGKKRQENTDKDCPFQASVAGGGKEALQMRQKSKQMAKIEASQKLEQVKSEQQQLLLQQQQLLLQQQRQLLANQRPDASPDARPRHHLLQGSSLADDVFLRPQAPPPSGCASLPHSPRSPHSSSSPLQQLPNSPQMFSPPSSRPASPWDPYSKPVGTPRPTSVQHCPPLSISPARDTSGSPAPSPDFKASDASRALALQTGPQHSKAAMKSPPSASQVYHRSLVQGGTFKAPMAPQNQLQQDSFCVTAPGARREPSRPADLGLPQSQDPAFHSGMGSPRRGPYAPAPGTPRLDCNLPMAQSLVQQSALPEAYTNPSSSYLTNALPALRPDHLKMASASPSHHVSEPHPPLPVHFTRSPGGTVTSDPYAKAPGTPRPSPDHYAQRPSSPDLQKPLEALGQTLVETSASQFMRSPLGGETATRKQSQQRDSFVGTSGRSLALECAETSEHRTAAAHVGSGASPTDETTTGDETSLGGPMALLPQLGDSEEKLRQDAETSALVQRQRLRQLILRQQQQKSALRQEKGLREAGPSPSIPASGVPTPHRWPIAPPRDALGRPPPPYPGTPHLPGEQLRGLTSANMAPFPPQRGMPLRFFPQDSFPHSNAGGGAPAVAPAQLRKPLPSELIVIRPVTAAGPHPHVLSAAPQAFPVPCALPVQQHSILGQPYIELRHRAPENRLRMPFSPAAEEAPPGTRLGETAVGQPVLLMVQLNQQDQRNLVHTAAPALAQGHDVALQGAEGIEEHLEGVESAVKDLEDVEVKDLVDLSLNLDPEDGKEDLDLGPNDLHLDDFLLLGKFDLIAYADPELNLEDKKDMFNEELDLGESVGEPKKVAPRKDSLVDSAVPVKEENEEGVQADPPNRSAPPPPPVHPQKIPGPDGAFGLAAAASGAEAAGLSQLASKGKLGQSVCGSGLLQANVKAPPCSLTPPLAPGPQSGFRQSVAGPSSAYLAPHPPPSRQTSAPHAPLGLPLGSGPHSLSLQLSQPCPLISPQAQPLQPPCSREEVSPLGQDLSQSNGKHLLLEEQPLLLQDLLDQERQEQQQQKQMQALIRHKSTPEPGIPDLVDFDSVSDPIMKAKMVALKGINKVMSQGSLGLNNMVINRFHQAPAAATPEATSQPPAPVAQGANLNAQLARPNPPSFGPGFVNDSQRRQYEEWLGETQRLLQMQQRLLEEQLAAHRKTKKALSAKQRTAKKAGREPAEDDAAQLRYVVEQQAAVQKQLEQIRKQQKDHTVLIEDYRSGQRQQRAPPTSPPAVLPQNAPPLPSGVQKVPPTWSAPLMPPALPTVPQAPATVPGLPVPASGFASGGIGGSDLSVPTPQVKFDDNNPFSEGFQERERRERLREQQERHRVQLMQGVEHHRLLQQHRLDADQQGGARLCPAGPAVATGSLGPAPAEDALSQIAFFSSELPQDFLQSPPGARPPAPGAQAAVPFPAPQQGFTGGLHPHGAGISPERFARVLPLEVAQTKARAAGSPAQVRPLGTPPTPPSQAAQGHHPFSPDSAFSSPSTALCAPFSSSSLSQLYADILPDDGPKRKKRSSVNRDSGAGTPLYAHSDIADSADTSCSTPARGIAEPTDSNFPSSALAPSLELERQLSVCSTARERGGLTGADRPKAFLRGSRVEVKEEREERGDPVQSQCASPLHDPGKELLRHLLREKASPHQTPSPGTHGPLTISGESLRSEDEDGSAFHDNVSTYALISDVLDSSTSKKLCKRAAARPDKDKSLSKCKQRRREDEDALDCSSSPSERSVTHLTQLSALPLMEPVLVLDLSPFPPYGSSSLGRVSRLSGSFGNACLDGVADYYAQLACKNILGNPPTPPASLPPTPPPQKLLNGFATAEEVSKQDSERTASCDGPKCGGGAVGPDLAPSGAPVKSKGEALRRAARTADVDVPASLPTPPHNNQEELRIHDSSPCASPDGFVPSSSPESTVDAEVSRYPDLSFVKTEALSPCPSPPIPIVPCSWGKGSALKREVKTEAGQQAPPSCSDADLVPIAITLNSTASQNVLRVMAAVAKLLRLPAPINYQLSRASLVPPALVAGVSVPLPQASASSMQQRTAPPTGARLDSIQHNVGSAPAVSIPPSCGFCKVLLGNGVRKIHEAKQEGGSSLLFCSPTCSALYSSGPKAAECAAPLLPQHRYANNMSSFAVHSLPATPLTPSRTAAASPPPRFPSASAITMETKPRLDGLKVKVKLKPHPHAFSEADCQRAKRTKSLRWRRWNVNVALTSRGPVSDKAVAVPTEEEADVLLKKLGACLRPDPFPADQRRCCFCHQQGDGETDGAARLLNLDLDLWVHLNCALWSSEVYETQAGALINVELALRRGLTLRCAHCQQTGATSGCNRLRCTNTYHFTCAIRAHCTFFKDKTMLCQLHRPTLSGPPPEPCAWPRHPYDSELRCFAVFRRVYVQRDEARQVAAMVQRGEQRHSFRVGSLLFCAVGRLLPRQMSAFHDRAAIFPVGYHANRIYWSMRHSNRRCKYMCFIEEQEARPLFKVKVVENGYNDLVLTAPTPKGVWDQILEPVARLRSSSGMLKLFPDFLKGEDLFGISASAVCRIIESLPGVEACERYTFRYGRNPLMEWPLAFNPSGSARSEPKVSQAKRPYLLTSMAPRCQGSVGSIVGAVPGVISLSPGETVAGTHQGRHSKLAQYRRMKADWKTNVYLARSRIQGLGLYAARDIEKCTMVIEYIGAIIRSEVADRKERLYESQNRGVYMFRIDNDYVIDATITGGPARYINHSCAPNCVTEVVSVEKENKIIISSCRRIQRGEELSYDYKFDLEDDQHKIPCHCGAFNCRKWMN